MLKWSVTHIKGYQGRERSLGIGQESETERAGFKKHCWEEEASRAATMGLLHMGEQIHPVRGRWKLGWANGCGEVKGSNTMRPSNRPGGKIR